MTPVNCRVKHNPPHSYGDCLRACVATILNLDAEQVPHFMGNGVTGDVAHRAMVSWLAGRNLSAYVVMYPPVTLDEVLEHIGEMNGDAVYMLAGAVGDGDHVVVCKGGQVVHDPAWYSVRMTGPGSNGCWQVTVLGVI